jgi:hypothetical protein
MPLPTTEIFAFSAPQIKAGEMRVAVNVGAGSLCVLRASRTVWRNLFDHLSREFVPAIDPATIAPAGASSTAKRHRRPRLNGDQRWAVYSAILARVDKTGIARKTACEEANVNYRAFSTWLHEYKTSGYKVPVLKPGGRLL